MRTTFISHGNTLLAPIIGLVLCAPDYVMGRVTLGRSRKRPLPSSPFALDTKPER